MLANWALANSDPDAGRKGELAAQLPPSRLDLVPGP